MLQVRENEISLRKCCCYAFAHLREKIADGPNTQRREAAGTARKMRSSFSHLTNVLLQPGTVSSFQIILKRFKKERVIYGKNSLYLRSYLVKPMNHHLVHYYTRDIQWRKFIFCQGSKFEVCSQWTAFFEPACFLLFKSDLGNAFLNTSSIMCHTSFIFIRLWMHHNSFAFIAILLQKGYRCDSLFNWVHFSDSGENRNCWRHLPILCTSEANISN